MKKSVKLLSILKFCLFLALITLNSGNLMASDSTRTHKRGMKHQEQSIVRKGIIDVQSIDKNKDGKVFQDQMDWNVISDRAGKCPICKMTLREVTVKQAKENLKRNGFKVKQ